MFDKYGTWFISLYVINKITKVVELGERRLVSMATGSEMKFPTLYVTRQP